MDWSALHFLFGSKTVIDDSTGDNTSQWQKKYMPVFDQFLLFKFVIECILGTINYWSIVANTSGEFFTVINTFSIIYCESKEMLHLLFSD